MLMDLRLRLKFNVTSLFLNLDLGSEKSNVFGGDQIVIVCLMSTINIYGDAVRCMVIKRLQLERPSVGMKLYKVYTIKI
mgnify:CR=1 FL=1